MADETMNLSSAPKENSTRTVPCTVELVNAVPTGYSVISHFFFRLTFFFSQ
jgi:hypothetical protein